MSAQKKILIVDDDRSTRLTLSSLLQSEGFRTATAPDGERALERAKRLRPDLIVLDLGLPGMDGWQTLRRLQGEPATATVPVMIVSARGEPTDVVQAVQNGAEYYVGKPFRSDELLRGLRVALKHR